MSLRPPEKRTAKGDIQVAMPTILAWVDNGYQLPAIYRSLTQQGAIACSFSRFKNCYYEIKKTLESSSSVLSTLPSTAEKSGVKDRVKKDPSESVLPDVTKNVGEISGQPDNHAEVAVFDPTAQKRLADMVFRKNRER